MPAVNPVDQKDGSPRAVDERALERLIAAYNLALAAFLPLSAVRRPLSFEEGARHDALQSELISTLNEMKPLVRSLGVDCGIDYASGEMFVRRDPLEERTVN